MNEVSNIQNSVSLAQVKDFRLNLMSFIRRLRIEAIVIEIPFSQLSLLGTIDRLGNNITPSELAKAEHLQSSNLAMLLNKLAESGFIKRETDAKDKRKVRVSLTHSGYEILNSSRDNRDNLLNNQINSLTEEEIRTLFKASDVLKKIANTPTI